MARHRVMRAVSDGWDWLVDVRYEHTPARLTIWVPRLMVALCWVFVAVGLVFVWLVISQSPSGAIGLVWVGSVVAVSLALQSGLPLVVADQRGVSCRKALRRQLIPWDEVGGLTLPDTWSTGAVLRIERRNGWSVSIFCGMLAVGTESRARAARHLARQLSGFSESIGNGPIAWPQHVTYFTSSGDQVDI